MQALIRMTAISAITGMILAACAQSDDAPVSATRPDQEPARVVTPEFDSADAEAAMNRSLDGSSVEAFEQSLAQVESAVTPEDFRKIQSALEWMLFYDYSVGGDKAKLYASLDGATPLEIIAKSERGKGQ